LGGKPKEKSRHHEDKDMRLQCVRPQILQPHVSNLSAVFASKSIEVAFGNTAGPEGIASLFFWGGKGVLG
jgi:hypothetical protein